MARSRNKSKGRSNKGRYFSTPHVVSDHPDYFNLSGYAVKLLNNLCRQYNGYNNGNLTVAFRVLSKRGWRSKTTVMRATQELLRANLIIRTREGKFLNPGGVPALYALTWEPIDDCKGKDLEVGPTTTPIRKFSMESNKNPCPDIGPVSVQNVDRHRPRDAKGRYVSVHKVGRLRVVT